MRPLRQRGALAFSLPLVAAVVAGALGAGAGWWLRDVIADRAEAEAREVIDTEPEAAIHTTLVETARRLEAQEKATRNARSQAAKARADAAAAGAAADGLRDAAQAAASACGDPATAQRGQADRLAHVLAEAAAEAGRLAEAADRAIVAGHACEASYYGLTK